MAKHVAGLEVLLAADATSRLVQPQTDGMAAPAEKAFGLAGVAGVNPIFLVFEMLIVLAWRNAGWIGLDRYVLPMLGTPWRPGKVFNRPTATQMVGAH